MNKLIVILGPTASGKTRLAVQVAHRLGGEIISADSRQVYRDMDIGTGKDLAEYEIRGATIPYHLINITDAGSDYNVYLYQQDFYSVVPEILDRSRVPILCGGTGLYIEAVLKGHQFTAIPINANFREELDQKPDRELLQIFQQMSSTYTAVADTSTRKRLIRAIEINHYLNAHNLTEVPQMPTLPKYTIFGIGLPVEVRRQRITNRLHERLQIGMIEEVQQLLERGIPAEKLVFYGLEYKFITNYLAGQLDYDTMVKRLETAIHQFAKRQMTFFRKMERDGIQIHWLDGLAPAEALTDEILITV